MMAVVPAAGRGSRLGELTAVVPKALVTVAGSALVDRVLHGLHAAGIEPIVIVTGHRGDQLEAHLAGRDGVVCVRQDRLDGTAGAVGVARGHVGDAPFLVTWVDVLAEPRHYHQVTSLLDAGADAVIGVQAVDDPYEGAAVYLDGDRVSRVVEKPARGTSTTIWNNAGISAFRSVVWPYVDRVSVSERGEREMTSVVSEMIDAGLDVRAAVLEGSIVEVGSAERLAEVERWMPPLRPTSGPRP